MKNLKRPLLALIALCVVAQGGLAQVPSANDTSDTDGNTGMGTSALGGPGATNGGNFNTAAGFQALYSNASGGDNNTAAGASALRSNTTGNYNTAAGSSALLSNTTGANNTAAGALALALNTTGNYNTALGDAALNSNTTGGYNTGVGYGALSFNKSGNYNTASGYGALFFGSSNNNAAFGSYALASYDLDYMGEGGNTAIGAFSQAFVSAGEGFNTAVGEYALEGVGSLNTLTMTGSTGRYNTVVGVEALHLFTTASYNAALGMQALNSTTTGNYNTASGSGALFSNNTGSYNTASGFDALYRSTGSYNTAYGTDALINSTGGVSNIALGYRAGYNVTRYGYNIEIGNPGKAADRAVIRIGNVQSTTYVAGISNASVSGSPVYVSSAGQLGLQGSSERFKTAISPMDASTEKLGELRPVTFQYKTDPHGVRHYGLIAEEVARVYPELVVRDSEGEIISVRYDELAPMLLNEMQLQKQQLSEQLDAQARRIRQLEDAQAAQSRELKAAVLALQSSQHND